MKNLFFFIPIMSSLFSLALANKLQWDVDNIFFIGNNTFSSEILIGQMQLKPQGLFSKTEFNLGLLQQDINHLDTFYKNRGFFQTEITGDLAFDSSKKTVDVILSIKEGIRTELDSVDFVGNVLYSDSFLTELVDLDRKAILDSSLYISAQSTILVFFASRGRMFARVEYFFEFDSSGKSAVLIFSINEGPVVRAGDLNMLGLNRVHQQVIKRELQFNTSEVLSGHKIRLSVNNLYNTGLFKLANIAPLDTQAYPSETDSITAPILIQVEETDFFNIRLGAGFDSFDKWYGSAELAYKNLFGLGHRISLSVKLSLIDLQAQIGYNYPWLFNKNISGEMNAYIERLQLESFTALFQGGVLAISGDIGKINRYRLLTSYKHTEWFHGEQQSPEKNNTLLLGSNFTVDARESYLNPGNAFYSSFNAEIAGPGLSWSNQFYRLKWDIRGYRSFFGNKLNLASAFFLGYVNQYGKSDLVPPSELLRIGIEDIRPVRGYSETQVSPTNDKGEAIGGKLAAVVNIFDFRFPLFSIFTGELFIDGGYVWPQLSDFDLGNLKWSAGPGLLITLPNGIFRIDYGFNLKRSFNFSGGWYLGLGSAF